MAASPVLAKPGKALGAPLAPDPWVPDTLSPITLLFTDAASIPPGLPSDGFSAKLVFQAVTIDGKNEVQLQIWNNSSAGYWIKTIGFNSNTPPIDGDLVIDPDHSIAGISYDGNGGGQGGHGKFQWYLDGGGQSPLAPASVNSQQPYVVTFTPPAGFSLLGIATTLSAANGASDKAAVAELHWYRGSLCPDSFWGTSGQASICVQKCADLSSLCRSGVVNYTYCVKNTGTVPLTNVVLSDDKLGQIATIPTLLAGASETFQQAAALTVTTTNVATATGTTPGGATVTDTAQATVTVIAPLAISYQKVETLKGIATFSDVQTYRDRASAHVLTEAELYLDTYVAGTEASYPYLGTIPGFPELGHFGGPGEPTLWVYLREKLLPEDQWNGSSFTNLVGVEGGLGGSPDRPREPYLYRMLFSQPFDGPGTAHNYNLTQFEAAGSLTPPTIALLPLVWIGGGPTPPTPPAGDVPPGWMARGRGEFSLMPGESLLGTAYGFFENECGEKTSFSICPEMGGGP